MAAGNSSGSRILMIAAAALALFLAVVFSGFLPGNSDAPLEDKAGKSSDDKKVVDEHTDEDPDGFAPDEMVCKSWPIPKAALILSGEQHGYIEPCGCTENQSGGVSRRANLITQLNEMKWPTAGLDLGGVVKRSRLQSQLKFRTMVAALRDMNYKAIGMGPEDIKLGPDYLLSQHTPDQPESIAFVCSNVTFYDSPELGTPAKTRVFEHGGLKFAVTGVLGKSLEAELRQVQDVKVAPPEETLPAVIEEMKATSPDVQILLSHGSMDEANRLAAQFPNFDLILTAGGAEDPNGKPGKVKGSDTVVLNVGHKGKYTGVLAIYPEGDVKFRFELVQLDRVRFKDTPKMVEHMRYYQDQLSQQQIMVAESPVGHPSGAVFVGSQACAECHEEEFDIWKKTPHADAFLSLDPSNQRHGHERLKGVPRMSDPECVCCHVTGWNPQDVYRYRSGYVDASLAANEDERKMSPILKGVGCENCHGPGSRHIELVNEGEDESAGKLMRVTKKQADSSEGCYKCHDLDNSPNFEFKDYWPKIAH